MGEYAEYSLAQYVRGGIRLNPNWTPKKRPKAPCKHCGKMVEATEGMRAHIKAKHNGE